MGSAMFAALMVAATLAMAATADLGGTGLLQGDGGSGGVGEEEYDDELLMSGGSVERVPENGVVDSVVPGSEVSCTVAGGDDRDEDGFKWFRVRRGKKAGKDEGVDEDGRQQSEDDEEGLNVTGSTVALAKLGLTGVVGIRCRLDADNFADFRVNFGNESERKSFRVKKFPKSLSVVNLDDLKVFCEVNNRSNVPWAKVKGQFGLRWYKWSVPNDNSFAAEAGGDDDPADGSINCTRESMEGSLWIEIEGAEILPGEPEPHIKLLARDDVPNAVIKIEDATEDDRRGYKCVAYNLTRPEECDSSVFFVRVKDKYAALWPFLGIVAEVVVLCLIILICERKRSAKLQDEEEDEEEPYNGNGQPAPGSGANSSDNSNIRQRRA